MFITLFYDLYSVNKLYGVVRVRMAGLKPSLSFEVRDGLTPRFSEFYNMLLMLKELCCALMMLGHV